MAMLNQKKFLVQAPALDSKASSLSYPMLPNHLMLNMLQQQHQHHQHVSHSLSQSQEALMRPKFGYPVHVEEENEMLLENELKTAAKLNESVEDGGDVGQSNENSNDVDNEVIEVVEKSGERTWPSRQLLSSLSTANIVGAQNRHNFRDNQFYRVSEI